MLRPHAFPHATASEPHELAGFLSAQRTVSRAFRESRLAEALAKRK
jgi:hypothetical protein